MPDQNGSLVLMLQQDFFLFQIIKRFSKTQTAFNWVGVRVSLEGFEVGFKIKKKKQNQTLFTDCLGEDNKGNKAASLRTCRENWHVSTLLKHPVLRNNKNTNMKIKLSISLIANKFVFIIHRESLKFIIAHFWSGPTRFEI